VTGGGHGEAELRRLGAAPSLIVGVDFDGTLSNIVDRPQDARALPGASEVLAALADIPRTWVAVISGRALVDLERLMVVPAGVLRVGSHGLETSGRPAGLEPAQAERLALTRTALRSLADEVPGVVLEPKSWSVAVHYRHADHERDVPRVLEFAAALSRDHGLWSKHGKEVVELFVAPASKAEAVAALRADHPGATVVYLGDDVTDEEVFTALAPGDLGVKIGEGVTAAALRLAEPVDALAWLRRLAQRRSQAAER